MGVDLMMLIILAAAVTGAMSLAGPPPPQRLLPPPPPQWSGPSVRLARQAGADGLPLLSIDGRPTPPLWLTLHSFHNKGGSTPSPFWEYEINASVAAGLEVLCVCLTGDIVQVGMSGNDPWLSDANPLDPRTRSMLDRVIALHPMITFIITFYAFVPQLATEGNSIVLLGVNGGNATLDNVTRDNHMPYGGQQMTSLTEEWERVAAAKLTTMLRYLDREYPKRIGGINPNYLHTSEWFMPGPDDVGSGWSSKLGDYSAAMQARFSAETGELAMPTPRQRVTPKLGNKFGDAQSTRLNLWLSQKVVGAILALAEAAKVVSGGKLLTQTYYGYHLGLSQGRMAGSGHLAFQTLMQSPHIDVISSPYNYEAVVRNAALGAYSAQASWDSPALHGKLWVTQDDTRTSVQPNGIGSSFDKFCFTPAQTEHTLKRNTLTGLLHGGIHFYGYYARFGRPTDVAGTEAVWRGIGSYSLLYHPPPIPAGLKAASNHAQIAIFVDETSLAALTPALSSASDSFLKALTLYPGISLGVSGAPVQMFLLSDLVHTSTDWGPYRLCVFLNLMVADGPTTAAINALKHSNRTLFFSYLAGGIANATDPADLHDIDASAASALAGMALQRGGGARSLGTIVPPSQSLPSGHGFPCSYGATGAVDPWMYYNATAPPLTPGDQAEVLGTLISPNATRDVCVPPGAGRPACGYPPYRPSAGCTAALGCCYDPSKPGRNWCYQRVNSSSCANKCQIPNSAPPPPPPPPPVPGLVRVTHANYTSIFSSGGGLPVHLWSALARQAGVHLYLDNSACVTEVHDSVEVRGRFLVVHAATSCGTGPRVVMLPTPATVMDEANTTVCSGCSTFSTVAMGPGDVQLFTLSEKTGSTR
jgi:hypothetical protein